MTEKSILVPTDGSPHARRALAHADYLAGATDATIHLLNVVDVSAEAGPFSAGGVTEEFVQRHREAGEDIVDAAAERVERAAGVERAVRTGKPASTILDYAAEVDADLLAAGTHGRTGVERYVLGSVAERLVRRADRPVLTARAPEADVPVTAYGEVVVATDGSDAASAAAGEAVDVAAATGADVRAVNVVDAPALAAGAEGPALEGILADVRSAGREAAEDVAEAARAAGVDATAAVEEGPPAETLLEAAADADLIAMGRTGRTGAAEVLLGSTTERVLRRADAPVLSVGAPESGE